MRVMSLNNKDFEKVSLNKLKSAYIEWFFDFFSSFHA